MTVGTIDQQLVRAPGASDLAAPRAARQLSFGFERMPELSARIAAELACAREQESAVLLNSVSCRGESDEIVGEFNKKFALRDRYVLDLTRDRSRTVDRRIAVAVGVLLDTGERR